MRRDGQIIEMSFLTEVSSSAGGGGTLEFPSTTGGGPDQYDYHLPHTKTIDLIGEEFAPRKESGGGTITTLPSSTTGAVGNLSTSNSAALFLNSNITTLAPLSGTTSSTLLQAISAGGGQVVTLPAPPTSQTHSHNTDSLDNASSSSPSSSSSSSSSSSTTQVITTLPFNHGHHTAEIVQQTSTINHHPPPPPPTTTEENGVLLCNLDELSRYIPENFYSDFNITEPKLDYLEHKSSTLTASLQPAPVMVSAAATQVLTTTASSLSAALPSFPTPGTPITIQLPTQPQPPQSVKTVTYVQNSKPPTVTTSTFQPVKLTTTGFAYTATGERIAIQGLADPTKSSTVQVQVKPQTLQLAGLDPSKLTVLQEIPDMSKVVIQDHKSHQHHGDSISNILEEMKTGNGGGVEENNPPVEYATAIPVAVTSLSGSHMKKPAATVLMPSKRSRNIIFAGNTLPQGAIPIQINGLNALPISAVKSLPINLGTLTQTTAPVLATNTQVVAARKTATKFELVKTSPSTTLINTITNRVNNNTIKYPIVTTVSAPSPSNGNIPTTTTSVTASSSFSSATATTTKTVGNNKTCSWVFENGEICGKTFSKSYNLVVHMRMHEDVRPFCCSLCDQTFRQKAHLQRHETTHGIGVKVSRSSSASKKRKKKAGTVVTTAQIVLPTSPTTVVSPSLQKRLARVEERFGVTKLNHANIAAAAAAAAAASPIILNASGGGDKTTKFTTSDIDEAIKAAVEGSNLGSSHGAGSILSLKREPSRDDDGCVHTSKIPRMAIKVEPSPSSEEDDTVTQGLKGIDGQVCVTTDGGVLSNSSQLSNRNNSNNSHSSSVTAQFVQHPGTTTIVIDNLEEHSPEIQKEILNALLADQSTGTGLFTIQSNNGGTELIKSDNAEHGGSQQQSFPPVTVQEFLQENSSSHVLVEHSHAGE